MKAENLIFTQALPLYYINFYFVYKEFDNGHITEGVAHVTVVQTEESCPTQ